MRAFPTRLKALDRTVQERLTNWGYAICDAGLRKHVEPPAETERDERQQIKPPHLPYPPAFG